MILQVSVSALSRIPPVIHNVQILDTLIRMCMVASSHWESLNDKALSLTAQRHQQHIEADFVISKPQTQTPKPLNP